MNELDFTAKIIADSEYLVDGRRLPGCRLTTMMVTLPKMVASHLLTHRQLSRNAASNRAMSTAKVIGRATFTPSEFGQNGPGMVSRGHVAGWTDRLARANWEIGRWTAIGQARVFSRLGIHKGHANRVLEPYLWTQYLVTANQWENFFDLRCVPDAQEEIWKIANLMKDALANSTPVTLSPFHEGVWYHSPWYHKDPLRSVATSARLSYGAQSSRHDRAADIRLSKRLEDSRHWSPFEHVAYPEPTGNLPDWHRSNFTTPQNDTPTVSWVQLRHKSSWRQNLWDAENR